MHVFAIIKTMGCGTSTAAEPVESYVPKCANAFYMNMSLNNTTWEKIAVMEQLLKARRQYNETYDPALRAEIVRLYDRLDALELRSKQQLESLLSFAQD